MRLVLAGALVTLTAASLALIRPALMTDEERACGAEHPRERLRADIRFLSSDLLEGRAPGTRGERLAREYVAARFEAIGLEPGIGSAGSSRSSSSASPSHAPEELRVTAAAETRRAAARDDYIAWSGSPDREVRVDDAEIVFVGYGIVAPEYAWDDFKGADLRGKLLLVMNNDPESDPALFAGQAPPVLRPLGLQVPDGGRAGCRRRDHDPHERLGRLQLVRGAELLVGRAAQPAGGGRAELQLKAWATEEACRRIARLGGPGPGRAARARREPRLPPGAARRADEPACSRTRSSAARARTWSGACAGSDPALAKEAVVFTAHHDHYGIKPSAARRDRRSTTARSTTPPASRRCSPWRRRSRRCPSGRARSILFASVTAEEQGLLGSRYLAQHLPLPPGLVAANVNIDGASIWGRTRDVPVIGLGKSSLDEWIRAHRRDAGPQGRARGVPRQGLLLPLRPPELRAPRRARRVSGGGHRRARPAARAGAASSGRPGRRRTTTSPRTTSRPTGTSRAPSRTRSSLFLLGLKVANAPLAPSWRPGDEFEAARKKALAEVGR